MGLSIWHLLMILAIVALLFGTKRLRNIGGDLGSAIKSFKSSMGGDGHDGDDDVKKQRVDDDPAQLPGGQVYDAESTRVREKDKV